MITTVNLISKDEYIFDTKLTAIDGVFVIILLDFKYSKTKWLYENIILLPSFHKYEPVTNLQQFPFKSDNKLDEGCFQVDQLRGRGIKRSIYIQTY